MCRNINEVTPGGINNSQKAVQQPFDYYYPSLLNQFSNVTK